MPKKTETISVRLGRDEFDALHKMAIAETARTGYPIKPSTIIRKLVVDATGDYR